MGGYIKGDVVLVEFPFSDLSSSKKRPALVIVPFNSASRNDALVCQITTTNVADGFSIELQNTDLQSGRILKTSYIRPNRLFTVDVAIIDRKVALLNEAKMKEVIDRIIQIIS